MKDLLLTWFQKNYPNISVTQFDSGLLFQLDSSQVGLSFPDPESAQVVVISESSSKSYDFSNVSEITALSTVQSLILQNLDHQERL